ncbi:MAG: BlaI/MecI/CopY family transcriptional regulator [Gemmatimonadetes bacterium]|nr:BlaI/MecI/CopY family transcriptional regulator [Gemmatimonadota bacterium]
MPDARDLTDLHVAILAVLWDRGEATVAEVQQALRGRTPVARKTVATLLARLEERGVVRRRSEGREGVYRAAVKRRAVLMDRMMRLLGAAFDVAPAAGAPRIVASGEVRRGDAARLRALLRKAGRDLGTGP